MEKSIVVLLEQGLPKDTVAKRLGIREWMVAQVSLRKHIRRNGMNPDYRQIEELLKTDLSLARIGEQVGRSKSYIFQCSKFFGIERGKQKKQKKEPQGNAFQSRQVRDYQCPGCQNIVSLDPCVICSGSKTLRLRMESNRTMGISEPPETSQDASGLDDSLAARLAAARDVTVRNVPVAVLQEENYIVESGFDSRRRILYQRKEQSAKMTWKTLHFN